MHDGGIPSIATRISPAWARDAGYRGMQFNAVVECNTRAVRLWQQPGFEIVGTVPEAFRHSRDGFVGLHIMYKPLSVPSASEANVER